VGPQCGVGIEGTVKLVTFGNLIANFVQSTEKTEWDAHIEGRMDGKSDVWLLYILHGITRNSWFNFSLQEPLGHTLSNTLCLTGMTQNKLQLEIVQFGIVC
jgi:hypothetical protein